MEVQEGENLILKGTKEEAKKEVIKGVSGNFHSMQGTTMRTGTISK